MNQNMLYMYMNKYKRVYTEIDYNRICIQVCIYVDTLSYKVYSIYICI